MIRRFLRWFFGDDSSVPSSARDNMSPKELYEARYRDTAAKTTPEIRRLIAEREEDDRPCGAAYQVLADRFNDPPRAGRKSYAQREAETSCLSITSIRAQIAEREADGKPCGILYRELAKRT